MVATGRSDFPNQVNNSLVFPGIFRGALDVRARTISDRMCFAAAEALAAAVGAGLDEEHLLPTMADWEVVPQVAAAVGLEAQAEGPGPPQPVAGGSARARPRADHPLPRADPGHDGAGLHPGGPGGGRPCLS